MSTKSTRRDLLCAAALGTAAAIVPKVEAATPAADDPTLLDIQSQLAKPLSDEAKALMPGALLNTRATRRRRLSLKMPDCSEPSIIYVPTLGAKP